MADKSELQKEKEELEKKKKKKTKELPLCEGTATAEWSRFEDEDEPCDDGRTGEPHK